MARSRRGRRPSLDWVQNDQSYSDQPTDIAMGLAVAAVAPLVHSHQTTVGWKDIDLAAGPEQMSMAAFPQTQQRTTVRAVRGQVWAYPVGWLTGASRWYGMRLTVLPQDPVMGDATVTPQYTMFTNPLVGSQEYAYADEPFLWEQREMRTFRADVPVPVWSTRVNWSGRRTLQQDEGLFLYIENAPPPGVPAGGGIIRVWTYLRTLCEVPRA